MALWNNISQVPTMENKFSTSVDTITGNFTPETTTNSYNLTEYDKYFVGGLYLHPHWQQYRSYIEDIPDLVHYALGLYIAFVGLFGTIGNLIVIWIFSTTQSLRTPPNMFIINLAVSDLGFSVVNGFPLMTVSCFKRRWMWGKLACELYGYLGGVFGLNSISTLAFVSLDRYVVIAHPFYAMRHVSHKRSALQILVAWIWAFLWSTPPMFGFGAYIPEGLQTSCSFDYLTRDTMNILYNYLLFGCGFVLPVMVTVVCYINIVRAVAAQAKSMAKTEKKMCAKSTKEDKKKRQEIQTAKIAAGTVSLFVISWLPYALIAQFGILGLNSLVTPYTCQIPVMVAKASAMWNPILYALSHPRFRAALEARVPWLVCCRGRNVSRSGSSREASKKEGRNRSITIDSVSECSDTSENNANGKVNMKPAAKSQGNPPPRPKPPVVSQKQEQKEPEALTVNNGATTNSTPSPTSQDSNKSVSFVNKAFGSDEESSEISEQKSEPAKSEPEVKVEPATQESSEESTEYAEDYV